MSDEWKKKYSCSDEKQTDCEGQCETCPSANAAQTLQQKQMLEMKKRIQDRLAIIDHQILVISGKGGVGKSTVSASLAWELARRDYRVGLLDTDLHGPTIPLMMGVADSQAMSGGNGILPVSVLPNLSAMSMGFLLQDRTAPVIWRGPIRGGAIQQMVADVEWGHLNYMIIDLPPGTGDEALTVAQSFPNADGAVVVTTPQEASLSDCRRAINFVHAVNMPVLGVIENMSGFVCPHCNNETPIFSTGGGEKMAREMKVPYLGRIPLAPEVVGLGDAGKPVIGPETPEVVKAAFSAIVDNVAAAVEGSGDNGNSGE